MANTAKRDYLLSLENRLAHTIMFGSTGTGKTFFAKFYARKFYKCEKDDIVVFTTNPGQWDGYKTVTGWTQDTVKEVYDEFAAKDKITKDKPFPYCVVFDDFNNSISTNGDNLYKEMFTSGRHKGIRCINLAHDDRAMGKTALTNSAIILIMGSCAQDLYRRIAVGVMMSLRMTNDLWSKLGSDRQYKTVIFDKERGCGYTIDKVWDVDDEKPLVVIPDRTRTITRDIDVHPQSTMANNPENLQFFGMHGATGGNTSFGNKSAHNMMDQSINFTKVDNNLKTKQMMELNQVQNNQQIQKVVVQRTVDVVKDAYIAVDIVNKQYRTAEEMRFLVKAVNAYMRHPQQATIHNIEEYLPYFMKRIDGQVYIPRDKKVDVGNVVLNTAEAVSKGKLNSNLGMGIHLFETFNTFFK